MKPLDGVLSTSKLCDIQERLPQPPSQQTAPHRSASAVQHREQRGARIAPPAALEEL